MLKVGDIYYLCDQYGPKFVKIITIGDIWTKDDNWVFFYKSTSYNFFYLIQLLPKTI